MRCSAMQPSFVSLLPDIAFLRSGDIDHSLSVVVKQASLLIIEFLYWKDARLWLRRGSGVFGIACQI